MKLFKSTVVYAFASILAQTVSFLVLPLYTSSLSIDDFALVSIIEMYIFIFVSLSSLSISRAAQRYYFDDSIGNIAFKISISIIIIWGGLVSVILLSIYKVFNLGFYELGVTGLITIFTVGIGQSIFTLTQVYFQVNERPLDYLFFVVIKTLTLFCSAYFFIAHLNLGVKGYLYSQLSIYACLTLYSLLKIKTASITYSISNKYNQELSKSFILFSLPYVPTVISQWVMSMSGRLIMENSVDPKSVAIYALGHKLSTAVFLASSAISMTMVPFIYKNLKENQELSSSTLSVIKGANFLIVTTGIIFITFSTDFFINFFGSTYQKSFDLISLFIISHYTSAFMGFSSNIFLGFYKKTKVQMYCFMSSAIIYLILSVILTNFFSIYGVVFASIISMLFLLVTHNWVITRHRLPSLNLKDFLAGLLLILAADLANSKIEQYTGLSPHQIFTIKSMTAIILVLWSYKYFKVERTIKNLKGSL